MPAPTWDICAGLYPSRRQIEETAMRTFTGTIKTDVQGSEVEFEFEVDDNATAEQIEAEAKQAAFELVQWHYEEVK
jgi:phosphoribosylanthranilate isomerase|nr:hypothetical protein [Pseudomonas aeruginosa]